MRGCLYSKSIANPAALRAVDSLQHVAKTSNQHWPSTQCDSGRRICSATTGGSVRVQTARIYLLSYVAHAGDSMPIPPLSKLSWQTTDSLELPPSQADCTPTLINDNMETLAVVAVCLCIAYASGRGEIRCAFLLRAPTKHPVDYIRPCQPTHPIRPAHFLSHRRAGLGHSLSHAGDETSCTTSAGHGW